eukprot:449066_1
MDPTAIPTNNPSNDPNVNPTNNPSNDPTEIPTNNPNVNPTNRPSNDPTNSALTTEKHILSKDESGDKIHVKHTFGLDDTVLILGCVIVGAVILCCIGMAILCCIWMKQNTALQYQQVLHQSVPLGVIASKETQMNVTQSEETNTETTDLNSNYVD